MTTKHLREVTAMVERYWSDWTLLDSGLGRHVKLVLRRGPHHRTLTISRTPSDKRALKNIERDLRHAIRELKDITA